jgi:hypothetical protein
MNLDLNPVSGAELQDIVADVVATPRRRWPNISLRRLTAISCATW